MILRTNNSMNCLTKVDKKKIRIWVPKLHLVLTNSFYIMLEKLPSLQSIFQRLRMNLSLEVLS